MNIGILGTGEVGTAIKKVAEKKHTVFTANRKSNTIKGKKIEVLHVCIPYNRSFVKIVTDAVKEYKPVLVIIESTVAPGTTDTIAQKIGIGTALASKTLVCHSPIRGIHPNLYEGVMTFVKYIGPTSAEAGKKARQYYKGLGLKTKVFDNALTTEIAKLMDTTYYGWNIVFQKEMAKICAKNKISLDQAYAQWNDSYNSGYTKLGMPYVVRPVLKNMNGKIGGHCVISNCEILRTKLPNPISNIILKRNKGY